MKNAMTVAALALVAASTASALPSGVPGVLHAHAPKRRGAPGSGTVALAGAGDFDCAAFVWDSINYNYAFLPGYADVKQAEEATMDQCSEGLEEGMHACEVLASWCGAQKCVAVAFSYDWQWYAYNPNPVLATVASTYALSRCTQNVCDALAWEKECSTGAPVCYLEAVLCGTEYQHLAYDEDPEAEYQNFTSESIVLGGTLDTTSKPATVLTANVSILSMNLPDELIPLAPLPTTLSDDPEASVTNDPAYVPAPTETASESASGAETETPTTEAPDATTAAAASAGAEAAAPTTTAAGAATASAGNATVTA